MQRSEFDLEKKQKEKTEEINKRIKETKLQLIPGMLRGIISSIASGTTGISILLILTNFAPITSTLVVGGSLLLGASLIVILPVVLFTIPMMIKVYRDYKKDLKRFKDLIIDNINHEYELKQNATIIALVIQRLNELSAIEIDKQNYKKAWQILFYLHTLNLDNDDSIKAQYKNLLKKYCNYILQANNTSLQTVKELMALNSHLHIVNEDIAKKTNKILNNYDSLKQLGVITKDSLDVQNVNHLKAYSIVTEMNKSATKNLRKSDNLNQYDYQPHKPYGIDENKDTFFNAIENKYHMKGLYETTKLIASKLYNRARSFMGGAGAFIGLSIVSLMFISVFFTPPGWVAGIMLGGAVLSGVLACYLDYTYSRNKEKQFSLLQLHKIELDQSLAIGNDLKFEKQLLSFRQVKQKLNATKKENEKLYKLISNNNVMKEMVSQSVSSTKSEDNIDAKEESLPSRKLSL